jgi:alanine-glyoxylate transaminase/serine-glyoxylate transaminase/serine-pyruvate transaminase
MNYALREALRLVEEEGLEPRFERHRRNHEALKAGLQAIGIPLASQEGHQLPMLNCARVPAGVDEAALRQALLQQFGIEIGGGLGPLKGQVWRIGLMGESSKEANVLLVLHALERLLPHFGHRTENGAALAAASSVYRHA